MQTTLLGLAIAFIIALIAALIGPYFIDWSQFRPQFEAEATRVIGAPVRVDGALDARLLPTPSLRLRSIVVGGANDLGKVRADKLDVEFSLGSLMRGEWRATELSINGAALDLGLDGQGRIDWPASSGRFNLGALAIDRLNLTGRMALHDAASRSTLELSDIAFSGDVRSLAGAIRGDGNFMLSGQRYPFRVSSGQTPDGAGTRVHLMVDPGARAFAADLDGVLTFDTRAPRFDGAITLARPAGLKTSGAAGDVLQTPWRVSAKLKADPAVARFEQLEASYGAEERSVKLGGVADIRFGASPLLRAALSARQLDADRLLADSGTGQAQILSGLRNIVATIPQLPIATQIEVSADQIMLGGRAVQNFEAGLRSDAKSWAIDRLEFRAPGAARVALNGSIAQSGSSGSFDGVVSVETTDPDTLAAWLQGRTEVAYRGQKPLRVRGNLQIASDRLALEALRAEVDGGNVEGRAELSSKTAGGRSRIEAVLKADSLDLDAAVAFVRSIAGPQAEWPDEGLLTLNIDRAVSAGQELRPLVTQIGYGPNRVSLDQLKIGSPGGVVMDGAGSFDRGQTTGKLTLNVGAASLGQITNLIAPVAPTLVSRLAATPPAAGAASVKVTLDLNKDLARAERGSVSAVIDVESPQLKGVTTLTAMPLLTAVRELDVDALTRSEIGIDSKLSSGQGASLLALLGLDRIAAAGDGPAWFEGTAKGGWRTPLQVRGKLSGVQLDAEAEGVVEPWSERLKGALNVSIRHANLAPLLDIKSPVPFVQDVSLSSRVTLAGSTLNLDDIDSTVAGSRLRGHLKLALGEEKGIEGQVGMDAMDLAPAFSFAIGAAGRDASDPLGRGLLQGWRGTIAFQALRGSLPGGGELRPISGVIGSDGQSLTMQVTKAGAGEVTADIDAKPTSAGLALNARIQFSGIDGAELRYRSLAMPAGRVSMNLTLTSQGRSASALAGALSGNGVLILEAARIAGLDPRAFDVAIRASDAGQATDDDKLRQILEPVLAAGSLAVASAQIPFQVKEGRIRVGATALDAVGARIIVSGGYDVAADQADVRVALTSTTVGSASSRPEIQVFSAGSPDRLNRTIDVAALSSWLAIRAIDRETRRLDSLERGGAPPLSPASIAPPAIATPPAETPGSSDVLLDMPTDVPMPGRNPRRVAPKPTLPRSSVTPPVANAPVASQQLAPLPPAIEVRPAPGVARPQKLRPPLVLTPPAQN